MLSFNAVDKYDILDGCRRVYTGFNPVSGTREELLDRYIGKDVLINGVGRHIVAVELFAVNEHPKGIGIGLVVKRWVATMLLGRKIVPNDDDSLAKSGVSSPTTTLFRNAFLLGALVSFFATCLIIGFLGLIFF